MKYWIVWKAIYENFTYSEAVTEKELADRWADKTIDILSIEPLD